MSNGGDSSRVDRSSPSPTPPQAVVTPPPPPPTQPAPPPPTTGFARLHDLMESTIDEIGDDLPVAQLLGDAPSTSQDVDGVCVDCTARTVFKLLGVRKGGGSGTVQLHFRISDMEGFIQITQYPKVSCCCV